MRPPGVSPGRWLGVALAVLGACRETRPAAPPAPPPAKVTLFFTAGLRGSLAPCGCSQAMRGGLAKTAALVARACQTSSVYYFDGGDALFGAAAVPEDAAPQQERKARAVAGALRLMGLAGMTPGPLDDARGVGFRQELGLPLLEADSVRVLAPDAAPQHRFALVAAREVAGLPKLAAQARAHGARFVVALVEQPFEAALKAALEPSAGVDLVLATRPRDELAAEESRVAGDRAKAVQLQSKGRAVLRVDLTLTGGGAFEWLKSPVEHQRELAVLAERVSQLRAQVNEPGIDPQLRQLKAAKLAEVVARREALAAEALPAPADRDTGTLRALPIEPTLEEDPAVREVVAAYDREVGFINLTWARDHGRDCPPPAPERAGFVGNDACDECHADALGPWERSRHATAYETLVHESKPFHLDCVPCHLTGWQQPGGVCRVDRTTGRLNVGCEACHGPGSAHVADPLKSNIRLARSKDACVGCHDPENSPHFDFDTYLRKLVGPGHGEPLFKRR